MKASKLLKALPTSAARLGYWEGCSLRVLGQGDTTETTALWDLHHTCPINATGSPFTHTHIWGSRTAVTTFSYSFLPPPRHCQTRHQPEPLPDPPELLCSCTNTILFRYLFGTNLTCVLAIQLVLSGSLHSPQFRVPVPCWSLPLLSPSALLLTQAERDWLRHQLHCQTLLNKSLQKEPFGPFPPY